MPSEKLTGRQESSPQRDERLVRRKCPSPGLGSRWVGREEEALVLEVLRSQDLFRYYGRDADHPPKMARTLETEFRELIGSKFSLAVSSGTAALEVALGALEVGPGDEVILPAWSWRSCWTAVVRLGALPVLAEIDETFCLAPGEISRLTTPRTKAVIVVHYQGATADLQPILEEAKDANIRVIEDCAQSLGATYQGRRVGTFGDIGMFSFQYQKSTTCGEGGMITTNDPLLYERAVRMHDLGLLRPYHEQFVKPRVTAFAGAQYRMSELQAAVALAQFRKLEQIRSRCREIQGHILRRIGLLPGLGFRRVPDPQGDSGFETYLLFDEPDRATGFRAQLGKWNVHCVQTTGTKCHYVQDYCIHRQAYTESASPFSKFSEWPVRGYRSEDFPRTEGIIHRYVAIPIGVLYTLEDAQYIADVICRIHGEVFH